MVVLPTIKRGGGGGNVHIKLHGQLFCFSLYLLTFHIPNDVHVNFIVTDLFFLHIGSGCCEL
jgi:hypothetical protein